MIQLIKKKKKKKKNNNKKGRRNDISVAGKMFLFIIILFYDRFVISVYKI